MTQAVKQFDRTAAAALIAANLSVLQQGVELLEQLDDTLYAQSHPVWRASGIGSHLRHCLDSYDCFLRGLASGVIDYDRRTRDERLERDRRYAQSRVAAAMSALRDLPLNLIPHTLQARLDSPHWTATSLERELQFLLGHTVHHYALIALLLRVQGLEVSAEFGVAPSTLAYWQQQAQAATPSRAQEVVCVR